MNTIRKFARKLILSLIAKELAEIERTAYLSAVAKCQDMLTALQAIDVGFKESGKIILLARVGGKDFVKIIDTPPNMTLREWRERVSEFEARFGAQLKWRDLPMGHQKSFPYP